MSMAIEEDLFGFLMCFNGVLGYSLYQIYISPHNRATRMLVSLAIGIYKQKIKTFFTINKNVSKKPKLLLDPKTRVRAPIVEIEC